MFGRRGLFGQKPRSVPAPADELISLSMAEVASYSSALVRRRGFPDDSVSMISDRVIFLERRGIPGFVALIDEMIDFSDESLEQRASQARPNGTIGGHCPIISAVGLDEALLKRIVSLAIGQTLAIPAPSNSILLLPKLARLAGPAGVILAVSFYGSGGPLGHVFLDGFRLSHLGSVDSRVSIERLAIRCLEEDPPQKLRAGFIDKINVKLHSLRKLQLFVDSDGFSQAPR